jgi:MFS family permease
MTSGATTRTGPSRLATLRGALADRDLARLLLTAGSWYATDVTSLLVVSVMAYDLGGPAAVGVIGATRVLPSTALGGLGALTDRFSRPRIVAGVNLGFVVIASTLAALAAVQGSVVVLAAVVAVGSVLSVLLKPNLQAMLPQLVRRPQDLALASSAYGTATSVGSIAGPALGGTLLAAAGPAPVWLVLAGVYAATAGVAAYIRTPFQPARRTNRRRRGLWSVPLRGLAEFASPGARVLVALFVLQRTMLGLVNVFVVLYAQSLTGSDGDRLSGGFFTVIGIGGLAGSVLSFTAGSGRTRLWFAAGIALWGLPVALLGATGGAAAAWVVFGLVGIGNALAGIFGYAFLNRLLADHVAGRAWGAFNSVGSIATAVGSLGGAGARARHGPLRRDGPDRARRRAVLAPERTRAAGRGGQHHAEPRRRGAPRPGPGAGAAPPADHRAAGLRQRAPRRAGRCAGGRGGGRRRRVLRRRDRRAHGDPAGHRRAPARPGRLLR